MYSIERIIHHWHLPHRRRPSGFEALALNFGISQIPVGMMALFGVLFLYELGNTWQHGLLLVLLFFGIQRVITAFCVPLSAKIIGKWGYRRMMLLSISALALKAWLLMQVTGYSDWLLWLGMALGGFYIASYYQGFHGLFLQDNDDTRVGEQIGLVTTIGRLSLVISPLLAGVLIDRYGFGVMFGVAMSLLIISLAPLFLMDHHDHKVHEFRLKRALQLLVHKNGFGRSVFWWYVENGVQTFFWPIWLFLLMKGSHTGFGLVGSLVMIISSLTVFYSGKIYDRRPLRRGQWAATAGVAASYVGRFWFGVPWLAIGGDVVNRFFSPFWWMKIRRQALLIGEKSRPMEFVAVWEWSVTLGFLTALTAGYLILTVTDGQWRLMGLLAILAVFMTSLSARKK